MSTPTFPPTEFVLRLKAHMREYDALPQWVKDAIGPFVPVPFRLADTKTQAAA
jgi:hypothetical protein